MRRILPDPEYETTTTVFVLVIRGGDIEEAVRIKQDLSLLNLNQNDEIIILSTK
jgi:hypothetical protein